MVERIRVEEDYLASFFGEEVYENYRSKVPSGIPFIQ
jgi:protein-S-isoprenylcysteine O-methyltransferase Ste14